MAEHEPRLWPRLWRRLRRVGLTLPVLASACMWGDVLYDTSQRALILDPVERVRFTVDSGEVEVYAFNRTAISLFYALTGSEAEIGEVGYEVVDAELQAFISCDDPEGFCNANFNVEVPYGTPIVATTRNGGVKLTGVDADVVAVLAGGNFEGVDLNSPSLEVEVEAGDVTANLLTTPVTVRVTVGVGTVDLTLPAGSYRCELQAPGGAVLTTGVLCDPAAASLVKIDVTTGDIHLQGAP